MLAEITNGHLLVSLVGISFSCIVEKNLRLMSPHCGSLQPQYPAKLLMSRWMWKYWLWITFPLKFQLRKF